MPDKDEFTFDDQDDLQETDLSAAFSEGEQEMPVPPAAKPAGEGGANRTRILLLVLLLVLLCAAGAYYFMDLGGTDPEVVRAPVQSTKAVALPPQPQSQQTVAAPAPAPPPPAEPAVAAPADAPPVVSTPAKADEVPAVAAVAETTPAVVTTEAPAAAGAGPGAAPQPAPVEKPALVETSAPVEKPTLAAVMATAATGPYLVDAGSYLVDANRDAVEAKIRKLGYEPTIEPVEAQVKLVRLRLGSFPESEIAAALAYVRGITPDAFSLPQGDEHVIYAGTFLGRDNIDALKSRLTKEGVPVVEEPVEVKRTLSRVRFGGFNDETSARTAAEEARAAGIPGEVVRRK